MNTDTLVLLLIFRTYRIILGDNVDQEWIIFKQQKFSLRVLLSICLIFYKLQPGVAYKNVDHKKSQEVWTRIIQYRDMFEKSCCLNRIADRSNIPEKTLYHFLLILGVNFLDPSQCSFPKLHFKLPRNVKWFLLHCAPVCISSSVSDFNNSISNWWC